MISGYICECVNTVNKVSGNIYIVNCYASNLVATCRRDCDFCICTAVNRTSTYDSSVFWFSCCDCVGCHFECCCNSVVCSYICESVNTVNKVSGNINIVNSYASNLVAICRSDCELQAFSILNQSFSIRSNCSVFTCSCSNCMINYRSYARCVFYSYLWQEVLLAD